MLNLLPDRLHRFLAARFSPEGEMGIHFTIGIVLILAAAWAFGAIAEDVVEGSAITLLDVRLAHWFRAHASSGFTEAMLFVTHWNGILGSSIMGALLAAWFWHRKAHYWLVVVLVSVPGGMLLNVALKHVFRRARPSLEDPLLTLSTYSFPSGHTAAATVFYGLLACYLVRRVRGWPKRTAVVAACCLMVMLVALSRMYLGVHYLSDVLAASAEGAAWLAVCITAVSTLQRRRIARARGREVAA
ncbi:phosphatase PAP2 family protein [Massilia sp. LXY-6]|uniref:phosphatase PAP2 family protein n=1 Tax=Massilia sp. LXY-6 TaxID=3379823 RepID=UPI003EE33BC0